MPKKIPPAVVALLLQFVAVALVFSCMRLFGFRIALPVFALLCGLVAAVLSRLANLAIWWLFIQLLFVPILVAMQGLGIPPRFFLAAFLLMLSIYWSAYRTQVPLYLSSDKIWYALEGLLPETRFHFIDLGSGLGGVLKHLASVRSEGFFQGIEYAPLPFLISRLRCMNLQNCKVRWGSLWDCNLAEYDVVFAYLSPIPMERLMFKARSEMRPGTLFISSTFAVPDHAPDCRIGVDDMHGSTLLVWRM